ncbi:MAG: FAD-dependent monooxygenase [Planctomycetes bacterium]|nr:FAD-dependent monooxygenase [Planctomycetota bacterium]
MSDASNPKFIIVGGGPGGALAAAYLGKAGHQVEVYEMRDDLRASDAPGGRSINLALSHRGLCALDRVGLADKVLASAVPMPGRMIHAIDGTTSFQPYGRDRTQAINSVSRAGLNRLLLEAADQFDSVSLFFNRKCTDVDIDAATINLLDTKTQARSTVRGDIILSADGAFSVVRRAMQRRDRFDFRQDYLAHGYKELSIPPGPGGTHRIEKNALHIWPRRSFMMIALPNEDGSFTCTLFWPFEGPHGFDAVKTESDLLNVFETYFPDAMEHLPTLVEDYFDNPVGALATIRSSPWYVAGRLVMLGDACHAVVPFYGQGMNAAFEDMLVLDECMSRHKPDWHRAFATYHQLRKANVDALADLAISNFVEMRDRTGSRWFLLRKKVDRILHRLLPRWYIPLYSMATFTRMPYTQAVKRAKTQDRFVLAFVILSLVGILGFAAVQLRM